MSRASQVTQQRLSTSLKQVDEQYIHATQAVKPKEETALDRRYQELLEQVRLLDTEPSSLRRKNWWLNYKKLMQLRMVSC